MQTPVFIESSASFDHLDFMITTGGYGVKYWEDNL